MITFRDTEDGLFWVGEGEDLVAVVVETEVDLEDSTVRDEQVVFFYWYVHTITHKNLVVHVNHVGSLKVVHDKDDLVHFVRGFSVSKDLPDVR